MRITILYNRDHELLREDPGREAREDIVRVAAALAEALAAEGHCAEPLGVTGASFGFLDALKERRPDLVLNVCESLNGDSRGEIAIPALLDVLGIPYTGSGPLALGLALHKPKAKEVLRARGVPTPPSAVIERIEDIARIDLAFPLIVKPTREDASVGIDFDSVVHDRHGLAKAALRVMQTLQQPALVERYVDGREIYVPLLGNSPRAPLPITEIEFGRAFEGRPRIVSYRAKWDAESPECKDSQPVPCALDALTEARLVKVATSAFEALGCRDYGRVDLRMGADGEPYVIDVNPNCDLHPEAGFAKAAKASGMQYRALAARLVKIALERTDGHSSRIARGPAAARRAAGPD